MDPYTLSDEEVLALTIIGEGRGEPIEGQVAIGCVNRNRLHHDPAKYKSYKNVCLEKEQFSCWNENDPNRAYLLDLGSRMVNNQAINDIYLRQCIWVAHGIYDWSILDNTKGSLYYLTKKLFYDNRPSWAKLPQTTPLTIGNQIFFNV